MASWILGTPTLSKTLRAAGYFTGHIGKWHSRFDTSVIHEEEPLIPEGDPDDPAVDALLRARQKVAQQVVKTVGGFDYADRINWGNITGKIHPKLAVHNIAWITDGSLDFLEQAIKEDRPFYLHLANSVPHSPDCNESLGADHRYTWGGKMENPPASHPADETVFERLREANLQTKGPIAGVNAGMVMIDDQIGAIHQKLADLGVSENTIFIYTADHGIPGKGSCHMIGHHLPFVMSWPGHIPAGQEIQDIFSWTDIVPTLCDACDVQMPSEHRMDGVSVLSALQNQAPWPRNANYHEMGWSRSVMKGNLHYIATRYPQSVIEEFQSGQAKTKLGIGMIFDPLNGPFIPGYFDADQLYDIQADPFERNNLIDDPAYAAELADLKEALLQVTQTMPRPFPSIPDPFLQTSAYATMLDERKAEMAAIEQYPAGADIPKVWYRNLPDPQAPLDC